MKRLALLVLVAALLMMLVGGCGGAAATTTAATTTKAATTAATTAATSGSAAATTAATTAAATTATTAKVNFPTKPITIVVPNAPGGGSDLTARAIAKFSQKYLGVSMVVENRDGGGQTVAHTYFKSVPKDGYTLIIYGNSGTTVAPILMKTQYDPMKDEEPIGRITNLRNALAVKADAPYKTLAEFIEYCKKNPGVKLSTSGANGIDDLTARMMNLKYKTGIVPVAYGSGSEAALAVLSGECQVACTSLTTVHAQVKEGKMRVLALACDVGDPKLPEYKTAQSLGYEIALNNSIGLAAPGGTDPKVIAVLEDFLKKTTSDPEFVTQFTGMSMVIDYLNAADFKKLVQQDIDTVNSVIKAGA